MVRNGLYSLSAKAKDGVDGGDSGVFVLRDGTIRGGTSFFYLIGTYSWTNTDQGAEAGGTALVGKRSIRYDAILRLLIAD